MSTTLNGTLQVRGYTVRLFIYLFIFFLPLCLPQILPARIQERNLSICYAELKNERDLVDIRKKNSCKFETYSKL